MIYGFPNKQKSWLVYLISCGTFREIVIAYLDKKIEIVPFCKLRAKKIPRLCTRIQ